MDAIDSVVDPLRDFAKDSIRLVKRCHKPDRKGITSPLLLSPFFLDSYDACERSVCFYCLICWIYLRMRKIYMLKGQIPCCMSETVWFGFVEFTKVAVRTAIGFVVMGFVGFFVKLIFIPINNIIVGAT
ncbi:unnamed protein product [Brassica napus]|uniref:(rape) hypothetical protein n=1 Tax=Brassica napus TaxID=3708 RepID=A0A816N9I8_BRANA|nr:unnamed protein product [Brassica napus]